MSLLGRLEDLSLTDIIQIVYLARRSGVLEVLNHSGRHAVLFRNGLVVNASSVDAPDLLTWFIHRGIVAADNESIVRELVAEGMPSGSAVLQAGLLTKDKMRDAIRDRIIDTIAPLLQSRGGEFNFLLSDNIDATEIEYDPDFVLREGGFTPANILEFEGDKLKPLHDLEESMKAGKQTMSSARRSAAQFRVAGGLVQIESPATAYRNVILFDRDAMVRVAAKRVFTGKQMKIAQFGTIDGARESVNDFFRSTSFFITFLEVTDESTALLQFIKRKNARLPVVMIDADMDLRARHDLLQAGADLYLTRPTHFRTTDEIGLFAEELALFAERGFAQWEDTIGLDSLAGRRFYEEAQKEHTERSFRLLQQLITEISDPHDVREVAATILRFSAEYLDRGIVFVVDGDQFIGVGGFGVTGDDETMTDRARRLRVARDEPSILADVMESGEAQRGKMRRTPANLAIIEHLGDRSPTEVVALPIMQGNRTIGILYGDNAEHRAPIDDITGLEIFLSQAGSAFESAASEREQ
jgi:DNA-binding NarL/FixJ family response regulator